MTGQEAHGQEARPPHVEVWQQPGGAWRWRYVARVGGERVELPSNEPDSSRDEAVHKASIAYPDLPVEVREPPRDDPEEGRGPSGHRRRTSLRPMPALVAAGAVVLAVLHPRWWTTWPAVAAVAVALRPLTRR
jgi:hypothetical protein